MGAETLCSLQKLEELLRRKEMEIASLEFELYSPRKKLSRFKNFETESNMTITSNVGYDDFHRKTDRMKEKKEGSCGKTLTVWFPSDKEAEASCSRASCSNHLASKSVMNCSKEKICSKSYEGDHHEIEWINKRVQVLEEDSELMNHELIGGLEERKELMNEICQQFQIIRGRLREKETGDLELHDGALVFNPYKYEAMETGLLQVIRQDSNPSLVTRCLQINDSISPGAK